MSLPAVMQGAAAVFLLLAVCGAIYTCMATWATWRFLRRAGGTPNRYPSISVLKPMHGGEPELYENLASFCTQAYGGPVQLILGVQDPADLALDVALRVKTDHPDHDIIIVSDATHHGANRKIGNLINMAAHAAGEVIIISDSDVRIRPDGLGQIVAALDEPGVGLIYCLYRGRRTMSGWSQLAAMDVNLRFVPSAVVGAALGAPLCLGPTMALRADMLQTIGGLRQLADLLADDFELGKAVRAAGHRVSCPPMLIDHVFPECSAREMLVHELRWARTIRLVEPAGYLATLVIHFAPLALIGAALAGFVGWSVALLAALGVLRVAQAMLIGRLLAVDGSLLWLVPLRDLLSFGVFLVGLFGEQVEWRGRRLRVSSDGAIAAA